jgi:hypothetical protein
MLSSSRVQISIPHIDELHRRSGFGTWLLHTPRHVVVRSTLQTRLEDQVQRGFSDFTRRKEPDQIRLLNG